MKKSIKLFFAAGILFFIILLVVPGCKKSSTSPPPNPCASKTITVSGSTNPSAAGQSNGSVTATATGSTGFTYNINGGSFQNTGSFNNLAAGTYAVIAKDADGCTGSQSFTIAQTDPCIGKIFTVSGLSTASEKCSSTGTIVVTAVGGSGLTYSINGTAYQASGTFTAVAAGTYNISAKDADGCVKAGTAVMVNAPMAGTAFTAVKTMMQTSCAVTGCHSGGNPTGGLNFTNDCTIVTSWDRIKARAIDASPSVMPPSPNTALSATDKQKITDWITAGHGYNN
jgi:hypothetical protein